MSHTVRPVVVDHLKLHVADLEVSRRFYRAALVDGLGWVEVWEEGMPVYGPPGAEDFTVVPGGPTTPALHIAFVAGTREAMERFHARGLEAGGRDNGVPGPRPGYSPRYLGAFLLDPDGHNVEAVWRPDV
jgi:catechol 2,3-dioxygenase-like lactoylglutathione lyase family enzyme